MTLVRLANGHATSAGNGWPGEVVELPEAEALSLAANGYGQIVAAVQEVTEVPGGGE